MQQRKLKIKKFNEEFPGVAATLENSCHMIQRSHPHLDIYPDKTMIQKDTCTRSVHCTQFTVFTLWTQPKCPSTGEQIKTVCVCIKWNIPQQRKKECHSQ